MMSTIFRLSGQSSAGAFSEHRKWFEHLPSEVSSRAVSRVVLCAAGSMPGPLLRMQITPPAIFCWSQLQGVCMTVYDSQCMSMTPVISDDSDYKAHSATHTTLGTMSDLSPCYLIKILNLETFVHLHTFKCTFCIYIGLTYLSGLFYCWKCLSIEHGATCPGTFPRKDHRCSWNTMVTTARPPSLSALATLPTRCQA